MRVRTIVLILLSFGFLATGGWLRTRFTVQFPETVVKTVEHNLRSEFFEIDREAAVLLHDSLAPGSPAWDEAAHYFVHADGEGIIAWSDNSFLPDPSAWVGDEDVIFVSNQRGEFLLKKWSFRTGFLICILTLKDRYQITNNFLKPTRNAAVFPQEEVEIVSPSGDGMPVMYNNQLVFRVVMPSAETRDSGWSFGAFLVGFVLLFAGLYHVIRLVSSKVGCDVGLVTLLLALFAIRWGMIGLGFPGLYFRSRIFDPRVFASSAMNASMGDLLFNGVCVLVVVLYLFGNFSSMGIVRWLLRRARYARFVAGMCCILAAFYGILFSFNFIEVIYHNSAQTLDITQALTFDWVRAAALLAVLSGTVSAFLFIHVLMVLARHLLAASLITFFSGLLVSGAVFFAHFLWLGNNNYITLVTGLVFFAMLRLFDFDRTEFRFSFRLFMYLIFSLTVFGIHHALSVRLFTGERQVRDQFGFAKDFLTERDVLAEFLLDQARQRIESDQFVKTRMASPFLTKSTLIDKIRRIHLNTYFDRYEVEISTRPPSDTSMQRNLRKGESHPGPVSSFLETGYKGITYSGASSANAIRRYHVSIPIVFQRPVGFVELDLALKRVVPDNVFPELFVDNRFSQIYRNRDFSYAMFKDIRLVNSSGSFNYERDFRKEMLGNAGLYREGVGGQAYYHVGMEEADGSVAVVSASTYPWGAVITNVCFWFVVGLALLLVVQGSFGIAGLLRGRHLDFTTRIQLFMFLAFALPVVAVSITTLTLLGRSSEEAVKGDFIDRSASAGQRIAGLFSQDTTDVPVRLESWIIDNTAFSKTDISIYSPQGKLIATSQPALFENHLLSTRLNREAWREIVFRGELQTVTNERIGGLQYSSAYAAVLSPRTGRLAAIVSLPFFESASFLQRGQILILSNILKVFVVVFLVFSVLSFGAAASLTRPIRLFTKTLRQTSFTGSNKPLAWNASDEIGMLVREYNRMVDNLEASKHALARSEKESAWREMAKQVAHEINNPLTPMKLTLQQIEQRLQSGELGDEKLQKSINVLLKQVEILNAIASSFSTLARMPAPSPQRVEVSKLLQEAVSLFSTGSSASIGLITPPNALWVSVDPTSMNRVLSNMLINAMQARYEDRDLVIQVSALAEGDNVVISIRDNGRGIDTPDQLRVFQPQFTTKQSGSGLGLALARQIIVQANGKIWFDSVPGRGTTFFVALPLVE